MRKLIMIMIIVMLLLLNSSLISADEKGGITDEQPLTKMEEDRLASLKIAGDMFVFDVLEKYAFAYSVEAFLHATGHHDLASKVLEDITKGNEFFAFDTFLKHYKKYKYNASDDEMALWTFAVLDGFKIGYHLGMHEALCQVFEGNKELADDYKNFAPRLYKQYLEDWKKEIKD